MCTAISFKTKDHYFARNLDYEYSFRETVTITPQGFPLPFRHLPMLSSHLAMIGMATVADEYPLYYEATNEAGFSAAGLNFPGNAVYLPYKEDMLNVTPFEFIPYLAANFKSVEEAKKSLQTVNIINESFSLEYPLSDLHWFIADTKESAVIEPTKDGIRIYDDPVGVLTNNPPFDYHIHNLSNYLNLTSAEPVNRFAPGMKLQAYSRGMGAMGLPGDLSSSSRFVRAAFTKLNSHCAHTESASISQVFHILGSVAQQEGCVQVGDKYEKTIYTSCCNTDKRVYYYTTYENSQISAVKMDDPKGTHLRIYPLITGQQIHYQEDGKNR